MRRFSLWILIFCFSTSAYGGESKYKKELNIPYYSEPVRKKAPYIRERCVLDIYYPEGKTGVPTVVWFHGGGLIKGNKKIPGALKEKEICIVTVNYRLHPKVKAPAYIEDAAAAVAWVFNNIKEYSGTPSRIFVAGHSAGGYLTSMIGLDKKWLAAHNVDANKIAGLIPLSGQTMTHTTIRKEKRITGLKPFIDDLAPLYHVRADAPRLLMLTGDRDKEIPGRYEENARLMHMMREVGHGKTRLIELKGFDHGIVEPACQILLQEIKK